MKLNFAPFPKSEVLFHCWGDWSEWRMQKDPWQALHHDFVSYVSLSAENNVEILIKYTATTTVKPCNTDNEMPESS